MDLYVILGVLGGLLAIDDRAGWQSLMAQPVFLGVMVGFITGELYAGMAVGLTLELIWLSVLPMRGTRKPDYVVGTIVGAGTACILIKQTGLTDLNFFSVLNYRIAASSGIDSRFILLITLGAFLGLLAAGAGLAVLTPLYEMRERKMARISFGEGVFSPAKVNLVHLTSIAFIFVIESAASFFLLILSINLAKEVVSWNNHSLFNAAFYWYSLVPVMGAAALIQIYWQKHAIRFLLLSTIVTVAVYAIK